MTSNPPHLNEIPRISIITVDVPVTRYVSPTVLEQSGVDESAIVYDKKMEYRATARYPGGQEYHGQHGTVAGALQFLANHIARKQNL